MSNKEKAEAIKYKIAQYEKELKDLFKIVDDSDFCVCDMLQSIYDAIECMDLRKLHDDYVIQIGQPILDMLEKEVPDCPHNYLARLEDEYEEERKHRREVESDHRSSTL
jgi:hypothetical protein